MKFFKKSLWVLLAIFFGLGSAVLGVGTEIARSYKTMLNDYLGIESYKVIDNEAGTADTEYYKSDYYKSKGVYDDERMRDNSLAVTKQADIEGATLLWNNDNALPLAKTSKISLFGYSQKKYVLSGSGSGYVPGATTRKNIKDTLAEKGLQINNTLWKAYSSVTGAYGNSGTAPTLTYYEYLINEVPWGALNSTSVGDVSSSVTEYCDAAIMIMTRMGGENGDLFFDTNECLEKNYLNLSNEEVEILTKLQEFKSQGKINKIILLINSGNAINLKHIKGYDIDACLWVGYGGNSSFDAIADLLVGDATPSGHLPDTWAYDADSAPAAVNFGDFTFKQMASGLPVDHLYSQNRKYVVYQEGIYVGYRYYETRYEDVVLGGRNANGTAGMVMSKNNAWNYSDEVAYTFGYGESYTDFEYSNFAIAQKGDDFEVSLTIKNVGNKYSGKDAMQVYLQKPYTAYDIAKGVEKASVELAGFAKTKNLAPGESQNLKVLVKGEEFKSYDALGEKTYILEKGDYYLAVGHDSHDALNNILAKKGKTTADGMDYNGNANFVAKITVGADDFIKYSKSNTTGYTITNQFDDANINLYEGTEGQEITYLSRNNWQSTYPTPVSLSCVSDKMMYDMQYGHNPVANPEDEMPKYNTVGKYGKLTLAMLMGKEYDDPMWDELLNQLTWEETNYLCSQGATTLAGAESVAAPSGATKDGPCGISIVNPTTGDMMAFPCEPILAATFNEELIEDVGDAFGMEILHAGANSVYGVGANTHRTQYSGRNWEYYSEDGYLAGRMCSSESKGLVNRGIMLFTKHYALNDQEWNRCGGTVWANEQSIREIYLKAYEASIVEGNCNGLMTTLSRIGCTWGGAHRGMLTEVLRKEWGFVGVVITDAAVGPHMYEAVAKAKAIIAGNDLWLAGGSKTAWDGYKTNAVVCQALRESAHRILYTRLNSAAMNGVSTTAQIIELTPWWDWTLSIATEWLGRLALVSTMFAVASFVLPVLYKKFNVGGAQ